MTHYVGIFYWKMLDFQSGVLIVILFSFLLYVLKISGITSIGIAQVKLVYAKFRNTSVQFQA